MCGNQQNKNPKIAEKAKIKKTPSNATKNRIEQNVMAHNSREQTFRRNKTLFFVVVCVLRPSAVATQSVPGRLLGCVVEFTCMQVLPTWCVSISFSSRSLGRNSSSLAGSENDERHDMQSPVSAKLCIYYRLLTMSIGSRSRKTFQDDSHRPGRVRSGAYPPGTTLTGNLRDRLCVFIPFGR